MSYSLEKVKMKNEDDRVRLSCSIMGRFLRECFDIVAKVEITFSSVYFLFFFFSFSTWREARAFSLGLDDALEPENISEKTRNFPRVPRSRWKIAKNISIG